MISLECDLCIFRKLRRRNPDNTSPTDKLLQSCIRRMNLDAFWSRSTATVSGHKDNLNQTLKFSRLLGMEGPFIQDGPLPGHDHCGYEVAADMLLYSRSKEKNNNDYVQFDTICKLRSGYGNFLQGAPQANRVPMLLGDQTGGRYQLFLVDPCGSLWFSRFMTGLRYCMGQDWRPNYGMDISLLHAVIDEATLRFQYAPTEREAHPFYGLRRHANEGGDEYFVVALLGKIKGEHHDLAHLLPCVHVTDSGVHVKEVIDDLIKIKETIRDFVTDLRSRIHQGLL
eukprot:scaffold29388_cov54-Attheya_sp.AAC.2